MKKLFVLLFVMLLPTMASAQECFNGIYYEKTSDGTYKVVKHPTAFYSGEITIPSTANGIKVTEIGDNAFFDNQNLTSVHLPITIEKIGVGAFGNCDNMHSIEIPENVNYIDAYAFGGIDNLTDVYCYANNLSLGEDIFYKTKVKNITLHVPEANFLYFKKADQWKKIKTLEATTKRSWAVEQNEREIAEQKRIAEEREREAKRIAEEQAKARQELINDSTMAMQGNADAQLRMAKRYEIGDGVSKDINKALDYYRMLGDQGNAEAQVHLGNLYFAGNGIDKNEKEALEWYRKAAEAGNAEAQYNLGRSYYYGLGVNKDTKTAMVWIKKSAAQNYDLAKTLQNKYEEEYGSYWTDFDHWRIVSPNDYYILKDNDLGAKRYQSNDFWFETFTLRIGSSSELNEIVNTNNKIRPEEKQYICVYPKDLDKFSALSDQEKLKVLKNNLAKLDLNNLTVEVARKDIPWGLSYEDRQTYLFGYYNQGKYTTLEASKAADEKALKEKLASFTKRFGFNPDGKGAKQLITYGRSLSLLTEWYYFRKNHELSYYFFNLHQDLGSQKCYGIYYAKDYYSNSGTRQGYIWVKGDRITSVEWK